MVQHAHYDEGAEAVLDAPGDGQLVWVIGGHRLPQHCQEEQQDAQVGDIAPRLHRTLVLLCLPLLLLFALPRQGSAVFVF